MSDGSLRWLNGFNSAAKSKYLRVAAILLCAISVFGYISYANSAKVVLFAYIDGEKTGAVDSQSVFDGAVDRVESEISQLIGENYTFEHKLEFRLEESSSEPVYLTGDDCYKLAANLISDLFLNGATLRIDGMFVSACKSADEIYSAVDRAENDYLNSLSDENVVEVEIYNSIEITKTFYYKDSFVGEDEVYSILTGKTDSDGDSSYNIGEQGMIEKSNGGFSSAQLVYVCYKTETRRETLPYETEYIPSEKYCTGLQIVQSAGKDGVADFIYRVGYVDGIERTKSVISYETVEEQVPETVICGNAVAPEYGSSGITFSWPNTGKVSSGFGGRGGTSYDYHTGIDISNPKGTPVYCSADGYVVSAKYISSYGNCIIVSHGDGYETYYSHLATMRVSSGTTVSQGQLIGTVGSTGVATGNHVHFEIRYNNTPMNPLDYLP